MFVFDESMCEKRSDSGLEVWKDQTCWIIRPYMRHTVGRLLSEVNVQLKRGGNRTVFDVCGAIVTQNPEGRKEKELALFKNQIKGAPQYLEQTVCDLLKAWIRYLISTRCINVKKSHEFSIKKLSYSSIHSFVTTSIHEWFCDTVGHMSDISALKITEEDFNGINKAIIYRIVSTTNWQDLKSDSDVFSQSGSEFSTDGEGSSEEVSDGEELYEDEDGSEEEDEDEVEDDDDEDDDDEDEEEDEDGGEEDEDGEQEEEDNDDNDDDDDGGIVDDSEEDDGSKSEDEDTNEEEIIDLVTKKPKTRKRGGRK